jgi:hypothetical protein
MVSIVHFSIIKMERNDRLHLAFMNYDYFENKKPKLQRFMNGRDSTCRGSVQRMLRAKAKN